MSDGLSAPDPEVPLRVPSFHKGFAGCCEGFGFRVDGFGNFGLDPETPKAPNE